MNEIEIGVVSQEEWAQALGCSTRTVRSMLQDGRLPSMAFGVGNSRRSTREQFKSYFAGTWVPPKQATPIVAIHERKTRKAS